MFALIALVASLGIGILIALAARLAPLDGLWIGSWMFAAGFAVAEIVAPARMIKWRARMMAGGPAAEQSLGQWFDNVFGIGTSADARSKRNMRVTGLLLIVATTAIVAFMWWAFHLLGVG